MNGPNSWSPYYKMCTGNLIYSAGPILMITTSILSATVYYVTPFKTIEQVIILVYNDKLNGLHVNLYLCITRLIDLSI